MSWGGAGRKWWKCYVSACIFTCLFSLVHAPLALTQFCALFSHRAPAAAREYLDHTRVGQQLKSRLPENTQTHTVASPRKLPVMYGADRLLLRTACRMARESARTPSVKPGRVWGLAGGAYWWAKSVSLRRPSLTRSITGRQNGEREGGGVWLYKMRRYLITQLSCHIVSISRRHMLAASSAPCKRLQNWSPGGALVAAAASFTDTKHETRIQFVRALFCVLSWKIVCGGG